MFRIRIQAHVEEGGILMRGLLRVATITLILSDSSNFLLVEHSFLLLRELNPFRSRGGRHGVSAEKEELLRGVHGGSVEKESQTFLQRQAVGKHGGSGKGRD